MLAFQSIHLQDGHQSESVTQGSKEMVERWQGILGRLDIRDALDRTYSGSLLHTVSEFPLTYRSEVIDKDSTSEAKS